MGPFKEDRKPRFTPEEQRAKHLARSQRRRDILKDRERKAKVAAFWASKTEEEKKRLRWAYFSGPDTLAGHDDI